MRGVCGARNCLAQRRRGAERFLAGAGERGSRREKGFLAAKHAKSAKSFWVRARFFRQD